MYKYILRRLFQSLFTLFIIITLVFLLMRLLPEEGYFGEGYEKLDEVQKEEILKNMGLRDPIYIQLINFYNGLMNGELGVSITYRPNVPVIEILRDKIPYSLGFGVISSAISIVLGLSLGIIMVNKKGLTEKLGTIYIVIISAIPQAIYYIFLQVYVSDAFNIPMLFYHDKPNSWILPLISMSLGNTANYAIWIRRYMLDELSKDYVKLAKAKGLKSKVILKRHVFPNAFVPLIQYLPQSLLFTIAGSIYIESLYSIPGMGGLLVDAIQMQDNSLVQAIVLIYSSIGIIGLFLGDMLMALLDPRISLEGKEGVM